MNNNAKVVGLGLVALMAVGCSQADAEAPTEMTHTQTPPPALEPEEAFLSDVEVYFPDSGLNALAEPTRITWAETACEYLGQGMNPDDLTFYLSSDGLLSQYDADMGIRVAVTHICPEHEDKLNTDHYGN